MKRQVVICLCSMIGFVLGSGIQNAGATNILLSDSGAASSGDPFGSGGYGYGYGKWDNMSAALDAASGNGINVVQNFENLSQVLAADALWLDQRWTSGSLSPTEVANLSTFIATGKRVVLVGENSDWNLWNYQILQLVGNTYNFGDEYNGTANSIVANPLTLGVDSVNLAYAGVTSGGTELFDHNWATLWGASQNVLTMLDVNVVDDDYWSDLDDAQFARNVACWISGGTCVPDAGSGFIFLGLGLSALGYFRRMQFA